MINDFLVTMVKNGIEKFSQSLDEDSSTNLVQMNSWMLNMNLIVSNQLIKQVSSKLENLDTQKSQENGEKLKMIHSLVKTLVSNLKWNIRQRSSLGIYDEKFWSIDDLIDLESAFKAVHILDKLSEDSSSSNIERILEEIAVEKHHQLEETLLNESMDNGPQSNTEKHKKYLQITLKHSTARINDVFNQFLTTVNEKYYEMKIKSDKYLKITKMVMEIFYLNLAGHTKEIESHQVEIGNTVECKYHKITQFVVRGYYKTNLIDNLIEFFKVSILNNMKFLSMSHLTEKKEFFSYLKDFYTSKKDLAIQVSEILLFNIDKEMDILPDNGGIGFNFGTLVFYGLIDELDSVFEEFKRYTTEESFENLKSEITLLSEKLEIERLKKEA